MGCEGEGGRGDVGEAQGGTEPDVAEAYCEPGEEYAEAGERKQPVEDLRLGVRGENGRVGYQADGAGEEDGDEGTAFTVDTVGETSRQPYILALEAVQRGRERETNYAKIFGAWCCSANAARVLEEP